MLQVVLNIKRIFVTKIFWICYEFDQKSLEEGKSLAPYNLSSSKFV